MFYFGLLGALLLAQATATPLQGPNDDGPRYDQGPWKVEVTAMREMRLLYFDDEERSNRESNFAIQVRVQGERIGDVTRYGELILDELVDDTGKSLIAEGDFTDEMRERTRVQTMPPEHLARSGLQIVARTTHTSARGAERIAKIKGTVRLVLAEEAETVTILDPAQYYGQTIKDPRLAAMGIEIQIASLDDLAAPPPGRCLVIRYLAKQDNVKSIRFFDGWMRPMQYRERPVQLKDSDERVMAYCFDTPMFNNEMQIVLDVHPNVEIVQAPLAETDIPLP